MKKVILTIVLLTVCSVHAQPDEKETLKQLNQKLFVLNQNQKYDEALKVAQQAVDLSIKIYGTKQWVTAVAYTNLGILYQEKKKYKESIENLQKAVDIYQKNSIPDSKDLIISYQLLAHSQFLDGKKREAEVNYLKVIEITESKFGRESKESFMPVLNMANFYVRIENNEKASDFYLKSYRLAKKYFGEESNEFESIHIYSRLLPQNPIFNDEFKKKYVEIVSYENGKAVSLPIPVHPGPLTTRRKTGRVIVRVKIDEEGNVSDAKMIFGDPFFQSSVENAAKRSKFKPTVKNGDPITGIDYITYNF